MIESVTVASDHPQLLLLYEWPGTTLSLVSVIIIAFLLLEIWYNISQSVGYSLGNLLCGVLVFGSSPNKNVNGILCIL